MPGRRDLMCKTLALLLMAGALSAVMGCARPVQPAEPELTSSAETIVSAVATGSASAPTTPPADPSAGGGASDGSAAGAESALSSQDASALDAELSAIQSELDRLSVPGDDDFDSIGDGLK